MYCHDLLRLPARELADEVTKMITYFSVNLTCQLEWKNRKLRYEISIKKNQEDTLVVTALSKMYEKIFVDQMYCIFINHFSLNMSGFLKQHFLLQRPSENYRAFEKHKQQTAVAPAVELENTFDCPQS